MMRIFEAMEGNTEEVARDCAVGRISADFYSVYPPGIPVLVPGELITEEILEQTYLESFRVVASRGQYESDDDTADI